MDKIDLINKLYNKAADTARLKKKKLLVIGSPNTGVTGFFIGARYGCGDICIDLLGCGDCKGGIQANINSNILDKLETNKYVVFECETIQYANKNKIDSIIRNLNRVSGGDIFAIHTIGGLHTAMGKKLKYPIYVIVFFQRLAYYIFFPKEGGLPQHLITDSPPNNMYKYLTY